MLFLDEIQACERALTSLKYFCEEAPQYHVVAAGALLGVAVNREKHSFPVGKVNELISDFKLYMADVGMLALKSQVPCSLLLSETNEANTFIGAFIENYVAQALTAAEKSLFYWTSNGQVEVDFVLQLEGKVVPVEVKRELNTRSRSITQFAKQYSCPYSIRISQKNFGFENSIKSVPLYAVFCI